MDPSYNDSFGSFGNNSDVVFQGTEQKNSKKKIIIIGVIVVLVIIAVVAVLVMSMGKNDNTSSLSKYMNLVVNGDEKNSTDIGSEYSEDKVYYLQTTLYDDDFGARIPYFDKLSELLDKIEKQNKDEDKSSSIAEQKEMLKIYRLYSEVDGINIDADLAVYASGGRGALSDRYLKKLSEVDSGANRYTNTFSSSVEDYYNNLIGLIEEGGRNSCDVSSYDKIIECDPLLDSDTAKNYLSAINKDYNQVRLLIRGSSDDFLTLAFSLTNSGEAE